MTSRISVRKRSSNPRTNGHIARDHEPHDGVEPGRVVKAFLLFGGIVTVFLFGYVDYVTGEAFSLQIFYLIPVALVAWFVSGHASVIILACSAVAWFIDSIIRLRPDADLVVPYWNFLASIVFFSVFIFILSSLKRVLEREHILSRIDFVTKVPNRRSFFETAEREVNRSVRYKHPLTIVYIDIDGFKEINDRYGHATGDAVLHIAAQALKQHLRAADMIARVGGDEFALLLPETGQDAARTVIERARREVLESFKEKRWSASLSIGAVTSSNPAYTLDHLLETADKAMYEVKRHGKNGVEHVALKTHKEPR